MDHTITGYAVIEVFSVVCALVHHHWGDETLSISAGEDDFCVPEWCSFTSMGPPHPVTCEELIGTYNVSLSSV